MRIRVIVALGLAMAFAVPANASQRSTHPDAVAVELYVMSQCPYGTRVEEVIQEVADRLGPELELTVDYIGAEEGGQLTSMHGPDEVIGDTLQLCAMQLAPTRGLKFITCQNKNFREIAQNWKPCAADAQIDKARLQACLDGNDGKRLLSQSFARSQKRGARGSPTIYVAGKMYQGRRSADDFLRSICNAHPRQSQIAACQNIPEPPKVNVIVLSDKRCTDCSTDRHLAMLQSRLANPQIKQLDYSDAEGKALFDGLGGTGKLPLVLFDGTLDADQEAAQMFGRGLDPLGNYRSLKLGASWNPNCANDKGCQRNECQTSLVCRKEQPNQLDIFVMSQCPFATKAFGAMPEVLKDAAGTVKFRAHYIATGTAKDGFNALHGQPEVDENIRQLCAAKYHPKDYQYLDYIWCRNLDIRNDNWEACTSARKEACTDDPNYELCERAKKINAAKIKKCSEGAEGKKLLEADIKIADSLGIGASPTWLVNNKFKFNGLDADKVRTNLCGHNPKLKLCTTLTAPVPAPAAAPEKCD